MLLKSAGWPSMIGATTESYVTGQNIIVDGGLSAW
jgi:hypothetical protein